MGSVDLPPPPPPDLPWGAYVKNLKLSENNKVPHKVPLQPNEGGGALQLRERESGKKNLHKHSNFWRNIIYIREAAKDGIPPPELSGPRGFF